MPTRNTAGLFLYMCSEMCIRDRRYAAALIMSGSAIRPKNIAQGLDTVAEHSGPLPTILKRVTRLQQEDFVKGTENDVNAIAVEKARSGQPLSQFFITCGGDDFALEGTKSVSYTHLDVYKRQPTALRCFPSCSSTSWARRWDFQWHITSV